MGMKLKENHVKQIMSKGERQISEDLIHLCNRETKQKHIIWNSYKSWTLDYKTEFIGWGFRGWEGEGKGWVEVT